MIPPELTAQIQRMLDGELSAGELASLEAELLENEKAREEFRRLAWLHSDLELAHLGQKGLADGRVIPIERIIARQRRRVAQAALTAAAAIVLISALVFSLKSIPDVPLASFRTSPGADFLIIREGVGEEATQEQELETGARLELRTGRVETNFRSGVRVVIEAPCDLRILAKDRVAISGGSAWFEVPPEEEGFAVETSAFTVVDLGTAFGIDAAADQHHEVHVSRGVVEVRPREEGGKTVVLKEGEARRTDGKGGLETIEFDAERFPTTLPHTEGLIGHWEFERVHGNLVPDASGNGHLGRLEGGAEVVTDPERGQVLRLHGGGSREGWVDIDSSTEIPNLLAHRGLTLAAWIKTDPDKAGSSRYAYVIGLGQEQDHPIATLATETGAVNGFIEGDGGADQVLVRGAPAVENGVWTHIAVSYDRVNNVAVSYVNGIAQPVPADISVVGDGELDWSAAVIGRSLRPHRPHQQLFYSGWIDEVRIYDRPLAGEDILELAR